MICLLRVFSFLAPEGAVDSPALAALLENLIKRVGERQARSLVAEVEESTYTFEALRKAGFSIYSRQRIWKTTSTPEIDGQTTSWRRPKSKDEFAIHALYNNLVPALVQQVEPPYWDDKSGYVFYHQDELLAFVDVVTGPRGIWLQPFFHPETDQVAERLAELLRMLKPSAKKPVYIGLRSYGLLAGSRAGNPGYGSWPAAGRDGQTVDCRGEAVQNCIIARNGARFQSHYPLYPNLSASRRRAHSSTMMQLLGESPRQFRIRLPLC